MKIDRMVWGIHIYINENRSCWFGLDVSDKEIEC